ncbi:THUMP domain-containing protein 3-like [Mizuhopecten yessoensis]|uniref:THUMP domain-containing protein 3 n=1 Tax=Mizuhopecten yessoensis TaxID=6573 RepID=A0A210PDY1_MIZYE|nr:THUMP domain-containing protein 3-like [Mizuhopecten yessoensis]OWF34661.1 THUMP domain-containing protein 3 [Mizuhopecten yessoensis]
MAAPKENVDAKMSADEKEVYCQIEATVPTGFEVTAKLEALDVFKTEAKAARGHIVIKVPIKDVKKVLELGCVDNCFVVMTEIKKFQFADDEMKCMSQLRNLVPDLDWDLGLQAWNKVYDFPHSIASRPSVIPADLGEPISTKDIFRPKKQPKVRNAKDSNKRLWTTRYKDRKKNKRDNISTEETENVKKGDCQVDSPSQESRGDNQSDAGTLSCDIDAGVTDKASSEGKASGDIDKISADSSATEKKIGDESQAEEGPSKKQKVKITSWDPNMPAFRVTCKRAGTNHKFDSMCAASNFGAAINNYFNWNVDMVKFDIEVVLNISENDIRVCLALTKGSLHKRNIVSFGPTTLRATIAYSMLRLCEIKPGDVVCDPMCGTGSIPIEMAQHWKTNFVIGGDVSQRFLSRAVENVENVNKKRAEKEKGDVAADLMHWDAKRLPLRNSCVDVFITDLPFGVRMGSFAKNWKLYADSMEEMARVCTPKTGRVVLLTQDQKCIHKTMAMFSKFWTRKSTIGINQGGIAAAVYVLVRTAEAYHRGIQNTEVDPSTSMSKGEETQVKTQQDK